MYTETEREALNTFYNEIQNCDDQIQAHQNAIDDRNCQCINYHTDLMNTWKNEKVNITNSIKVIENNEKLRVDNSLKI